MIRRLTIVVALLLVAGCAGFNKECAKFGASQFGSNWIVVQYDATGKAFNCWKLHDVSVTSSDGGNVDWQDPNGHLVHITGWENRVQVRGSDFDGAAKLLGVDSAQCGNGAYPLSRER